MRRYVKNIGFILIIFGHYYFCSYVLNEVHNMKNYEPKIVYRESKDNFEDVKDSFKEVKKTEVKTDIKPNNLGTIYIPKISLRRNLYDLNSKKNDVDKNIQIIKGSSMPDVSKGNLILAGHNGNTAAGHFRYLYKLSLGDLVTINYKGVDYNYKIAKIYDVFKTGNVAIYRDKDKKAVTLITCLGNDKQLVVIGYLKDAVTL